MRVRITVIAATLGFFAACAQSEQALIDEKKADLGRQIFFDTTLSQPTGQSCASCHSPSASFAAPAATMTAGISHGADATKFAKRNSPSIAYAAFSPPLKFDAAAGTWVGGQFLDHRSATLAEQAQQPFLSAAEMGNANSNAVLSKVQSRPYAAQFKEVFGAGVFGDSTTAYRNLGEAIAEFERGESFNRFSSKFDAYRRGKASLTATESEGLALFNGKAKCSACHPSEGKSPLFTDFTNDNIGVPKNTANPFYTQSAAINPDGVNFIDRGLGATLGDSAFDGRFKVPSLRNVAATAPYMHNGVFTSLRQVVQFYNSACAAGNPDGWADPEVADTRNCKELGDLGLTDNEIDAVVAFLATLTDGYSN
jgi:cytochrome c peroxidase